MDNEGSRLTTKCRRRLSSGASTDTDSTNVQMTSTCTRLKTIRGRLDCPARHESQRRFPNPSQSNLNRHKYSPNTPRHQRANNIIFKDTIRLTEIRHDDALGPSNVRSQNSQILLCDPDGHVGLGALLAQHRLGTRNEGSPRERATQSRQYLAHRETETRNRDQQPQVPDKSQWSNELVSVLLTLTCLSILRQEETGFFDRERSQSRENTCYGR